MKIKLHDKYELFAAWVNVKIKFCASLVQNGQKTRFTRQDNGQLGHVGGKREGIQFGPSGFGEESRGERALCKLKR